MYSFKRQEVIDVLLNIWSSVRLLGSQSKSRVSELSQSFSVSDSYLDDRIEPVLPSVSAVQASIRERHSTSDLGRRAPVIKSGLPEQKRLF